MLAANDRDVQSADGHVSLVRTNILRIDAAINVGSNNERANVDFVDANGLPQATTFRTGRVSGLTDEIYLGFSNRFFTGQLVRYDAAGTAIGGLTSGAFYYVIGSTDGSNIQLASVSDPTEALDLTPSGSASATHTLTPVQRFTVLAETDISLDLLARLRDAAVTDYTVAIDAVRAGRDIDILLRHSIKETATEIGPGVRVKWPANSDPGKLHYLKFTEGTVADADKPRLNAGVYGGSGSTISSTYDFRALDSSGARTQPALVAGHHVVVRAADTTIGDPRIDILGIVETPADGHIEVVTDGYVGTVANPFKEHTGDMRVGRIESTGSDVVLSSRQAIIDATAGDVISLSGSFDVTSAGIVRRDRLTWKSIGVEYGADGADRRRRGRHRHRLRRRRNARLRDRAAPLRRHADRADEPHGHDHDPRPPRRRDRGEHHDDRGHRRRHGRHREADELPRNERRPQQRQRRDARRAQGLRPRGHDDARHLPRRADRGHEGAHRLDDGGRVATHHQRLDRRRAQRRGRRLLHCG